MVPELCPNAISFRLHSRYLIWSLYFAFLFIFILIDFVYYVSSNPKTMIFLSFLLINVKSEANTDDGVAYPAIQILPH